jgi:hypothetical protein
MCKKICKIFGIVAVLTAAILLGLPHYYSLHGRHAIETMVQSFNVNQNIQSEVTSFTHHWFSSDADVAITIADKGNKISFINHIHAVYGPLMFIKTVDNKFIFNVGQAFLTFSTVMPAANSNIKFNGPMLKGQAFISLNGAITTQIKGLTFQSQNPRMALNGITWNSRVEADKQQVKATIGAFNRQGSDFNLVTQPIIITQDLTNSNSGIGLGDLIVRAPSMMGEVNHSKFDYKNIVIKAITTQQDNNLNAILTTNVANYQANNSTGTSSMICKLENLNANAYVEYSKSMREILKHGAPKKEMLQIVSQYMPQLLQKSTRLSIDMTDKNNISGNTQINFVTRNQNNNLISTADIDWDKFVLNNQASVAKTHIAIENLNATAMGKIIDKLGSMNNFSMAGNKGKADLELMQAAVLIPQIFQPNTEGRLITQITSPQYGNFDLMTADVQFAKDMSGTPNPLAFLQSLIINIKFTAPKEMVDTIMLQDGPTIAKTTPILHALNIEDKNKFEQIKKYFAYWQQQGYISVDGINYVTQISIANKETLVNGKLYQPLNPPEQAAQQVSLNQQMAVVTPQNTPQQGIQYPPAGQIPQTPGPQFQPSSQQPANTQLQPAGVQQPQSVVQQAQPGMQPQQAVIPAPQPIGVQQIQQPGIPSQQPMITPQAGMQTQQPSGIQPLQQPVTQPQQPITSPQQSSKIQPSQQSETQAQQFANLESQKQPIATSLLPTEQPAASQNPQ